MSERRRALIARFRAGGIDRLRKVTFALLDVEGGRATSEQLEEVLRDLHTLKGESKMLDFQALSDLVHAAEDCCVAIAGTPDTPEARASATRVLTALDVATRYLKGELGEDEGASAALASGREALAGQPRADSVRAPSVRAVAPPPPDPSVSALAAPTHGAPEPAPLQRWVSVSARQIDALCELVSEFETEFRSLQFKLREQARSAGDGGSTRGLRSLVTDFDRCRAQLDDITSSSWALRLAPIEPLLAELLTHARSLAATQMKRLRVTVGGGHVQLERSIIDALGDPLLHLIRNAVDHGVEAPDARGDKGDGHITIRAEPSGQNVVITVADDGRGIDRDSVRKTAVARGLLTAEVANALGDEEVLGLLFTHGFSTRREVNEVSGRGVGLDVVRSSIEAIGGVVGISSVQGAGTRFTLDVPATISKDRNLVIEASDNLYAIPSRHVGALTRLDPNDVQQVAGGEAITFEGRLIPLHSLSATVGATAREEEPVAVILENAGMSWAFAVPKLRGEFSLLRRPIDRIVSGSSLVAGSATFEDGRIILILSISGLVRHKHGSTAASDAGPLKPRIKVLAIDDSAIVRDLLVELLGHAGFDVTVAAGGEEGLASLATTAPDIVLLDVDMPRMHGFDVLREIDNGRAACRS